MENKSNALRITGQIVLGGVGCYLGYEVASDAIEYAKTIGDNPDTLAYVLNKYPKGLTKTISTLGVGSVMANLGGKIGSLGDRLFPI